jgi:predicted dehydrogenase
MADDKRTKNAGPKLNRRDALKGLATVPVAGAFLAGASTKLGQEAAARDEAFARKQIILDELGVTASPPLPGGPMTGDPVRVGVIGFGIRGEQLARALGFATTDWIDEMRKGAEQNPNDTRLADFQAQEDLNVQFAAVSDAFDLRRDRGVAAGSRDGVTTKNYRDYRALLDDPDIDAVVIATPDHWHAKMAMDALAAGKHVYVEKCMTHKIGETYALYDAVKASDRVFQVGHQHRQTQSFVTAREIVRKNVLGHISLVQTNTNRNDDNGAWQYYIHPDANPDTVDWDGFLGPAPKIPFNAEHFFRWRKWWPYGTGLTGDLLTHDYDRINCLLEMGIPKYCSASGGIYTHRDGRTVPDVLQVVMEYPDFLMGSSQEPGKERGMSFVYSATLGNQYHRGTLLMGHDATLELGNELKVRAEATSTRYRDLIEDGVIDLNVPMYAYDPSGGGGVDAVTGATAKYFADKGLLYTYRDGKRVDSTFLHLREWLSGIRNGEPVSCGIEEGFDEAISAHMSCIAVRLGKRVEWDRENRRLVNVSDDELESLGMT